ncbi:TerC family protein [Algicella marina]|uniref:Tellurium resistance protein TerC n=1 Tax=Algicella marina TaxID=2683284 RepID=A0A6P1SW81_9RHOB|nr:tellurium resistance protein TerC [Algicella marina]QHQ34027.1 tellurium resistance protein TerC [Algicella marina]
MADLFTLANLGNLGVLIFLQAVLGFDNLLYISIESQRAPIHQQKAVRRWGIIIAVALRIILLFAMIKLISALEAPFFSIDIPGIITGDFNFAVCVFLFGGGFIMYTAVKEISHLLSMEHLEKSLGKDTHKSATAVVSLIVLMNLIFSFDSVLSALAITDVFPILAIAILVSGAAMLLLADTVSEFIKKNRMYEVLGLFVLLIVGVVLLGEGGHEGHIHLFGYAVEPMAKSTFYFSIAVLFLVEFIQSGYQRKLAAERAHEQGTKEA